MLMYKEKGLSCLEQHNNEGTKYDLARYRIETAKSDLRSAKLLLEADEYRGANNRAYYAIYHAISAVHALAGKAYKRHKDALSNFNKDLVVLFESELEGNAPRELVNLILEKQVKVAAVFAQTDVNQYRYVIGSRVMDVRPFAKILNEKFQGRGGGKPEMVQGSVMGVEAEIRMIAESTFG